jgi:hypothetical protein
MSTVTERITGNFPAVTAAADQSTTIAESHVAGTVTAATITINGNITANATTYRTFTLVNKGTDGNGHDRSRGLRHRHPDDRRRRDFDEKALTLSARRTPTSPSPRATSSPWSRRTPAHGLAAQTSGGRVEIEVERTA